MADFALILPAGGASLRFGPGRNKLFATLAGRPIIIWSLLAFLSRRDCAQVIIPTRDPDEMNAFLTSHLGEYGSEIGQRIQICPGGATRAHSVASALKRVDPRSDWLAIHDAARPLVSQDLINRTLALADQHGAAVPALPVHLTIKQATGPLPAKVERTVPRQQLWAMQTPQVMRRAALIDAFDRCMISLDQITDDAQLLEAIGQSVWLLNGDDRNIKITTSLDLTLAEAIIREE